MSGTSRIIDETSMDCGIIELLLFSKNNKQAYQKPV